MATHDPRPGARGDEAELFRAFNDELVRAVSHAVNRSTPQNIEDACAFAWAQFLEHQPDRDLNWQGWMFRTAQRQAWLLERHARETLPLWEDRHKSRLNAPDALEVHRSAVRHSDGAPDVFRYRAAVAIASAGS
jgi:hypothetical protein